MFDLKNNSVKIFDRSIPKVDFENVNLILELSELFNTDKNMYYYMGLVLIRLGFETEDNIMLSNYNKDNCSFDCVVNDELFYKIRIDKNSSEIIVSSLNNDFGYVCEEQSFSEIGMRVSLGRYTIKYSNGVKFTRYLSRENMKFRFELSGCVLELELLKPNNMELPLYENGIYVKYKLDNEEDLVKYIIGLSDNVCLVDVYKKLNESYLGDVSKYPKFMLKKSKKIDGNWKVTDLILLNNGQLEQFGMTNYGRTVFLDKDDNWSYEMPMEDSIPISFAMSYQDGKRTCVLSSYEENEFMMNYIGMDIKNDMEIAMNEIIYTRKKVLELFGNNEGSN